MKRFLAILSITLFITLATSMAVSAQEHTPKRPPVPGPTALPPGTNPDVNTGGWVRYTSEPGLFSVLMPVKPEEKTETTQSEHGPYTTHLFISKDTTNVYLIGWVDYDPKFNFNKRSELLANRDNFIKGINATLLNSETLKLDGYDAVEFTAEANGRIFRSRVYMVGRRPYQIVIGYPKDAVDTTLVNRFFNSFKVRPT
ncbi:MAG TPA: hypothetical protein VHH35_04245 [Pyrinomonadaceae bacterium]|nr:hypothetical protein [Pyrinomonadaceae bacterium]